MLHDLCFWDDRARCFTCWRLQETISLNPAWSRKCLKPLEMFDPPLHVQGPRRWEKSRATILTHKLLGVAAASFWDYDLNIPSYEFFSLYLCPSGHLQLERWFQQKRASGETEKLPDRGNQGSWARKEVNAGRTLRPKHLSETIGTIQSEEQGCIWSGQTQRMNLNSVSAKAEQYSSNY